MKRKDLIKILLAHHCVVIGMGGKYDIYHNPKKDTTQLIPKQDEINEILAKKIIKDLT